MSRTLSLVALSTLLLATAIEAYSGRVDDADVYRNAMDQQPTVVTRLVASTEGADAASKQGDNCSAEGYPWLDRHGQPVEG